MNATCEQRLVTMSSQEIFVGVKQTHFVVCGELGRSWRMLSVIVGAIEGASAF